MLYVFSAFKLSPPLQLSALTPATCSLHQHCYPQFSTDDVESLSVKQYRFNRHQKDNIWDNCQTPETDFIGFKFETQLKKTIQTHPCSFFYHSNIPTLFFLSLFFFFKGNIYVASSNTHKKLFVLTHFTSCLSPVFSFPFLWLAP